MKCPRHLPEVPAIACARRQVTEYEAIPGGMSVANDEYGQARAVGARPQAVIPHTKESLMSKLLITLLAGCGIAFAGATFAADTSTPMSKDAYKAQKEQVKSTYDADIKACKSMSGNAKDVCEQEAKGKRDVAMADAEAAYKGTPSARYDARVARVESQYKIAKEKCDDLSGNAKDVCVKQAKAAEVKGKADAKVDKVATESSNDASRKTADARHDAAQDKRDAEYKVAKERCDSMSGDAKDQCVKAAKMHYGKS
jgi:hypothetical protein